jgi:hypothetical protein
MMLKHYVNKSTYIIKSLRLMALNETKIFLASIEYDQNRTFENKFIKKDQKTKLEHVWNFSNSEKNMRIWENINKKDWVLFYYNSRYTYAGKIIKKEKSSKNAKKIFGDELQNKNLIIYCNEIYQIKKGFQKTNSDMGFQAAIPEMHKIKLLQAKEISVNKIIEKFGKIEKYLEIKRSKLKSKEIEKIIPSSIKKESQKIKTTTLRRVRDTVKSKKLKKLYQNKCQICNYSFPQYVKSGYSEVHHVWPMANEGDDDFDNMLVLCPNHHTEFDYRVIQFNSSKNNIVEDLKGEKLGTISFRRGHHLDAKNILFHNTEVRRTFFES